MALEVADPWQPLSEERVRAAVEIANVPALLMVVFQMSGDRKWLQPPYLPTRGQGLTDHDSGGLAPEIQDEIRREAGDAIVALARGVKPAIATPSPQLIVEMMSVFMGEPVAEEYGPMLSAELIRRLKPELPDLTYGHFSAPPGFRVIVIGAGVSGIIAAHHLDEMGVEYVMLEKQDGPGGNWWQNNYPGAGVDTPSHLYSFSFAKNDWQRHFELRDDLQQYLARAAMGVDAGKRIRYGAEVLSATYAAEDFSWDVVVRDRDGSVETLRASVVISAVGVLNRAVRPDINGLESFAGPSFHSSGWPDGADLKGKRVGLVGTGASAMQIACAVAEEVDELIIFQRSPQWVAPFDKFQQPIRPELRELLRGCPLYHAWYWLRLFWQFGDKVIESLRADPDWPHLDRSMNARNDGHRQFFTRYLESELEARPELIAKALPHYPPFGKRILLDNGWYRTLLRENVALVDAGVAEVREHSLVTETGDEYDLDAVVWATGFDVAHFLASMDVRGRDGTTIREAWDDDDPRAYLGVSVPGFPNLFILGGPNSFPGSGSFMYFMEVQMSYIRRLLTAMVDSGLVAIEASRAATDAFNERVDELHAEMVWTHPGMSTWYRNSRGRVVFLMPFLNVEYWGMTQRADLENYTVHPRSTAANRSP
jgi:4-hydroxyacetophenone monooxygenase